MSYTVADSHLVTIRARLLRSLPDTCIIVHEAPGTVNPDGSAENGTITNTTSACRVAPSGGSPQETLIASRLTDVTPFTITLPYNVSVAEKDKITYQNATYEVMGTLAPRSFQVSVAVVVKRIT